MKKSSSQSLFCMAKLFMDGSKHKCLGEPLGQPRSRLLASSGGHVLFVGRLHCVFAFDSRAKRLLHERVDSSRSWRDERPVQVHLLCRRFCSIFGCLAVPVTAMEITAPEPLWRKNGISGLSSMDFQPVTA